MTVAAIGAAKAELPAVTLAVSPPIRLSLPARSIPLAAAQSSQLVEGHSLTSTWIASDSITLKNVVAYRESSLFSASALAPLVGAPFVGIAAQNEFRNEQTSEEIQVNYSASWLTATAGEEYVMRGRCAVCQNCGNVLPVDNIRRLASSLWVSMNFSASA